MRKKIVLIVVLVGLFASLVGIYLHFYDIYISYPVDGYGVYESCAPQKGQECLNRLNIIAGGGFKLVINYAQMVGKGSDEIVYSQQAGSAGLKIIWNFGTKEFWDGTNLLSRYKLLADTCYCNDNDGFIRYVVTIAKNSSATWGYYVGDEPPAYALSAVAHVSSLIHQSDSGHPQLFVAGINQDNNLPSFAGVPNVTVIAKDFYPVGRPNDGVDDTGQAASFVQRIANQYHKESGMVLQAHNLAQISDYNTMCAQTKTCRFPTVAEMQQMRNLTLQMAKPRLILWFSFYSIYPQDDAWKNLIIACGCS